MTLPFKIYQVKNKAGQQAYVYMGKPKDDPASGESFYPHMFSGAKCEDVYLFTTLVGSKNVRLTPSTLKPRSETNNEVLKDPFVHLDTRWYHFRYPGRENDVPENLPPNNFIKYHSGVRGDYTVEWRKLTSDGSVLIKPSLFGTVFWNGNKYINDSEAGYFEAAYSQKALNDDLIYLKTRHYIEVLRNTVKADSLSIVYKKYIDECKWKSTYLMKRFRGSYCVSVQDKTNHIEVGVKPTPNKECECGCISCWEIVNSEVVLKYTKIDMAPGSTKINLSDYTTEREQLINLWIDYKAHTSDLENTEPVTMTWVEQFEYNWLNNMGYNRYLEFPIVVPDEKVVEIKFNRYSDRQNRFYGINPNTATREHHAMPPVKPTDGNPHVYSYTNTHSLYHPDFYMDSMGGYFDRYATTPTKVITKGRIDDGKERVVVPPGVIFRTYKAVPGVLSLYELDSPYRRPDEYHFAVDGYGNILGYKSLPYPAIIPTEYPVEVGGLRTAAVDDTDMRNNVKAAWDCYFSSGKNEFCDETTIDAIHQHRIENNYFLVGKTLNPQDKDYLVSCEIMSGANTIAISGDDSWAYTGSLNQNRKYHASVKFDGKILVTGGFDKPDYILASCEIYNPNTGVWTPCAPMNERRHSHTATVMADGKIFVAGGYNETGTLASCEIYDPLLDTWTIVANAISPRQNHTATLTADGSILVAGGFRYDSECRNTHVKNYLKECEMYDPATDIWRSVGSMRNGRIDHTATLLLDGNVLVYGGFDGQNYNNTYDYYNAFTDSMVNSVITFANRRKHTAEILPSGKVILIGGYDENGALNTCDVFDSYMVSSGISMNEARFGHTSVTDGTYIHVVGGSNFLECLKSTEVYDIANQIWYPSADTNTARFEHTSHIVDPGVTVAVGGSDCSVINEAEIISGGAVHTYVNIHHCPIWIDKDIFCSYHAVEDPKRFVENDYLQDCQITIDCEPEPCDIPSSSSSSSSSSTPPTSGIEVSSSSSVDKISIIVDDEFADDQPDVIPSSSSSSLAESNEPREPVTYDDDIKVVNAVHGAVDVAVAGNYSFKVPSGVKRIKIMVWGAGGGGGGYAHIDITNADREHTVTKASGGAGGAGGHIKTIKNVVPLTNYSFTVGKGGSTGKSTIVEGRSNSDGTVSWYDEDDNLIPEPVLIKAVNGSKGGDSNFDTLKAYGGNGGTAGSVQKNNGLAGVGGNGSPGGTSPTLAGVEIYSGKSGKNGEYILEGPKGPAQFGGSPGFAVGAMGGICSIPGAGEGGDGQRNNTDSAVNGQDGRVRIEW